MEVKEEGEAEEEKETGHETAKSGHTISTSKHRIKWKILRIQVLVKLVSVFLFSCGEDGYETTFGKRSMKPHKQGRQLQQVRYRMFSG